jgi:solute carrier family 39 (zinc transporter), member 9
MLSSSFLAGSVPLSFSLSPSRLKIVTTLGMGVLVGTSLIVIIPEGVETLYSANEVAPSSSHRRSVASRSIPISLPGHDAPRIYLREEKTEVDAINALPGPVLPGSIAVEPTKDDPPKTPTEPGVVSALDAAESLPPPPSAPENANPATHHAWMGVSLIAGFILMYLIDTLPSVKPQPPPRGQNIYSLSDLGASPVSTPSAGITPRNSFSTTLGLVIHAAADGIALGASSTQPALSFIIFFAIMVHKAPAAFGLTSVLLKQGLSKRQARTHLVMFSLAAPAGAVVSWLLIGILGGGGVGSAAAKATKWWTGVILLFSGGTFL